MSRLAFFAKPSFLGNDYKRYTDGNVIWRLSSEIRAKQIAEHLGSKYNPATIEPDDICIYVKPGSIDHIRDGDYVDYCDPNEWMELDKKLCERPKIKVIALTPYAYNYLRKRIPNTLTVIPNQHLNWENTLKPKRTLTIGGYIGRPSTIAVKINREIERALRRIGIGFTALYKWETRQDSIDFYKNIDFLVIGGRNLQTFNRPFTSPTKMINAASFGVPSIAYQQVGYGEFEGYYTPFQSMDDLLAEVEKLTDEGYYEDYSQRIIDKAKEYHISKIATLYSQLT